jgi:hypothetical protein
MKGIEMNQGNENVIRLRAYHPTYMVCYFGCQDIASPDHNKEGFESVYNKLRKNPETTIELIEEFDDICLGCKKLKPDSQGSVWGDQHSCTSSANERVVATVKASSQRILKILDLDYGSRKSWKDLVELLNERLPELGDTALGDQVNYEKGLEIIKESWRK